MLHPDDAVGVREVRSEEGVKPGLDDVQPAIEVRPAYKRFEQVGCREMSAYASPRG